MVWHCIILACLSSSSNGTCCSFFFTVHWDQDSLPRRSTYLLFLVSRPNRTSVWCWTYKNVLPSPTHGFCFSFFAFSDWLHSLSYSASVWLVINTIHIFWVWGLKCSIQRDVILTSFCSLAAEVLPAEWFCLYICMFKVQLSSKWAVVKTGALGGRMFQFCFDHCHGPGGQILSVLCLSPLFKMILCFWREDGEGKGRNEWTVLTGPSSHSSSLDFSL